MTRLRSLGLLLSVAAATALLSAPVALAEHGDRDRGRAHDERAVAAAVSVTSPAVSHDIDDDDVNDDRLVQVAPGQPQPVVEVEHELNDLNDDDD